MVLGKSSTQVSTPRPAAGVTVVARATTVAGELTGTGAVRVEGTVKGTVRLEAPFEVAEGAMVEAEVWATRVEVAGTVTGNLNASEVIVLAPTAWVRGDVSSPALQVVDGARLEGRVNMKRSSAAGDPPRPDPDR
jgi:cytoskeletal protein CcmA (bactofilin family)